MELAILDTRGLPDGSILSVRSGPTRRQSPMPCSAPFKLPAGPWPLRIDVLALLGKSQFGAALHKDSHGCCSVPLEAKDGRKMSVTFEVFDGKTARPKVSATKKDLEEPETEDMPKSPARRRDTEAEARAYLDRHLLHEFMHALFELLLRERPTDPYSFIAARFREEALHEPRMPHRGIIASTKKGAQTQDPSLTDGIRGGLAATSIPEPVAPAIIPEGSLQVSVRTMCGRRNLMQMVCFPSDKVSTIKSRIEARLGVPCAGQQLFWWAEAMPNDTTLQDHILGTNTMTVNLVCSTRESRLRMSLSGSSDGGLRLYNLETSELIKDLTATVAEGGTLTVSQKTVFLSLAVHWESMRALCGAFNGDIQLWDIEADGRGCLAILKGHTDEVNCLEVSWPSMRALSGAGDGLAKLWDLNSCECVRSFRGDCTFFHVAADWTKNLAFGGLRTGIVHVWDMSTGNSLIQLDTGRAAARTSNTAVASVSIDAIRGRVLSGLEDGHLAYWHFSVPLEEETNVTPLKGTKVLLGHYSPIRAIASRWVETDSRALCGSDDGTLSLWRLDSHVCVARFAKHVSFVWALCADWSRGRAMSGAFDGCIKLWDLRKCDDSQQEHRASMRTIQSHSRPVRSIACG
eukprot:TRINITY_DN24441_c0_g1_i1.p1 TRINITY_DN24441_c0_g1~~TRINITY_DN24441_c0_g1_i1.p1  ORF type:complete len:631 (-),score=101.66 TRINITY_DN24441_c0_g1_i1:180-2072(-)